MNKRQHKKRQKGITLFLGKYIYISPKEDKLFYKMTRTEQIEFLNRKRYGKKDR